MKISEIIKELTECKELVGDIEVTFWKGGEKPISVKDMWIQFHFADQNEPPFVALCNTENEKQVDLFRSWV
jgi:hypothetical protein